MYDIVSNQVNFYAMIRFLKQNHMSLNYTTQNSPFATYKKTRLETTDVFEEMYVAFANELVTDPFINTLLMDKSYVFDFMPFESIKAVYEKPPLSTIPQDMPRIQLTITRMQFSPMTTCSKLGEIALNLTYESPMHQESTYKLASYLSSMLALKTFMCVERSVRVISSSAQFNYNTQKFNTTVQQEITLQFEMSSKM